MKDCKYSLDTILLNLTDNFVFLFSLIVHRGDLLSGEGGGLSAEINRSVEVALRRLLGNEPIIERSATTSGKRNSDDRLGSSRGDKPVSTRIHGRISSGPPDDTKETIGFDDPPPQIVNQPSAILSQPSMDAPPPVETPVVYDEPPVVKPKSKAERMLGLSTDPKSGIPIHDNLTSTKQSGLFGSIGSLFSSKPGSSAPSPSGGGLMSGFGQSSRTVTSTMHSSPQPKPHALGTIVDEGNDEQSEKKSQGSLKKNKGRNKEAPLRESFGGPSESTKSGTQSVHSSGAPPGSAPSVPIMNPQLVAEIANEEVNYRQLMSNLLNLADVKVNVKKELKDWQIDFQNKFGREPTVEDKMAINDRFIAYKMVSRNFFNSYFNVYDSLIISLLQIVSQVQEAKDLVKASESKLKELREKAANPQ